MPNEIISSLNSIDWAALAVPGLCHYLILALILFVIGIMIMVAGGNLIKIVIGLEFMLNAICINFIAANSFINSANSAINQENTIVSANSSLSQAASLGVMNFTFLNPEGQVAAFIVTVIGVINIAACFGLICAIYYKNKKVDTRILDGLKSNDCPELEECSDGV